MASRQAAGAVAVQLSCDVGRFRHHGIALPCGRSRPLQMGSLSFRSQQLLLAYGLRRLQRSGGLRTGKLIVRVIVRSHYQYIGFGFTHHFLKIRKCGARNSYQLPSNFSNLPGFISHKPTNSN